MASDGKAPVLEIWEVLNHSFIVIIMKVFVWVQAFG